MSACLQRVAFIHNIPGVASFRAAVGSAWLSGLKRFLSLGLSIISSLFEPLLLRDPVEAWLIEVTGRGRSTGWWTGCGETGGDTVAMVAVLCKCRTQTRVTERGTTQLGFEKPDRKLFVGDGYACECEAS